MLVTVYINGTSPNLLAIVVSIENDVTPVVFTMRVVDSMGLDMNSIRHRGSRRILDAGPDRRKCPQDAIVFDVTHEQAACLAGRNDETEFVIDFDAMHKGSRRGQFSNDRRRFAAPAPLDFQLSPAWG